VENGLSQRKVCFAIPIGNAWIAFDFMLKSQSAKLLRLIFQELLRIINVDSAGKVVLHMMYPFLTLDDNTEIVHSEMLDDKSVKVYIEKPDSKDCFHYATCFLPAYQWTGVSGFTDEELHRYQEILESTAHLILEFSKEGGFENASGL
jgi:hypothetical protein